MNMPRCDRYRFEVRVWGAFQFSGSSLGSGRKIMQQLHTRSVRLTPVSKFVDTILFARDIWGRQVIQSLLMYAMQGKFSRCQGEFDGACQLISFLFLLIKNFPRQAAGRQAGQNLSPLSPSAACSALCPLSRVTHSAPRILWELGTKSGIQVNYFKRIRLRNAPCGYFRNAPDSRCTFRTKFCIPLDFFLENGFTTRNYTSMRQCNSLKSYIVGPLFLKQTSAVVTSIVTRYKISICFISWRCKVRCPARVVGWQLKMIVRVTEHQQHRCLGLVRIFLLYELHLIKSVEQNTLRKDDKISANIGDLINRCNSIMLQG